MKYTVYVNNLQRIVSVNPVTDGGDLRGELGLTLCTDTDLFLRTANGGLKLVKNGVPVAMSSSPPLTFTTQRFYKPAKEDPLVTVRKAFNALRVRHVDDTDAGWDCVNEFLEQHGV